MQNWHPLPNEAQRVAVLLYPRFSNHCLANAVEPMRAANDLLQRQVYGWDFVTLDGQAVTSSSGLPVLPAGKLSEHPGGDLLFVISSYDQRHHATAANARALRAASGRFRTIVGLDTGSWLMAEAGLLDGYRATIHWDELDAFAERFPGIQVVTDRFVKDRTRFTCGGAMTAFDLTLDLIRERHGAALRLEVAALFMFHATERPENPLLRRAGSALVNRCIALMSTHLETPLDMTALARHLAVSQRTLARAFQAEMGVPPRTVYRRLRLMSARRYAEQSGYGIAEIALRCGYRNPAAMTRAFVAEFGVTPSELRARRPAALRE